PKIEGISAVDSFASLMTVLSLILREIAVKRPTSPGVGERLDAAHRRAYITRTVVYSQLTTLRAKRSFDNRRSSPMNFVTILKGEFLMIAISATLPLFAQTGNAVVQGTALDSSKAVITAAKVTLRNSDTGVVKTAPTSNSGVFYFGAVQPRPYVLTVEAPGFKKWEGTLTVEVGQITTIDPTMEVGTVGTTVEVTGVAPVISTEGMQVSDVKDALRIHQLPLNGRSVSNLFNLTPGVEGGGSPRTNGMKVGSTEMLVDGISIVDRFGGGISRVQPGLDTVQEFRIETSGSSARYSRPATVTLVTKAGGNVLQGAIFETL